MKKIIQKIISLFQTGIVFGTKKAPDIGATQHWYGRVNWWAKSGFLLAKETKLMKKHKVTGYIIEMAGWGEDRMRQAETTSAYKSWLSDVETAYKTLHKLCCKHGLWLFVCIVNDNALSNKHGNKAVDPNHYYAIVATDLLKIVLKDGNKNVVVQPVSELYPSRVSSHPGVAWQRNAINQLAAKGFLTCNNSDYGRPSGYEGCNFKAWHPNSINSLPSGNTTKNRVFIVSDTGTIISELNGGTPCDIENANCNPAKIKEWTAKANGFAVIGYYDFARIKFNPDAIKAMGK